MKTRLFLLIVFLSISNYSMSQKEIQYGFKAGVNFAKFTGDVGFGFDPRIAYHFGLIVEIELQDNLSLQPELLFSSQGTQDLLSTDEIKTAVINLSINAKYYVFDELSIEVGPQIGLLTSARSEFDNRNEDIKDDLSTVDYGLNFGLGYKFENGLNFGFRYHLGLSDLNKDGNFLKVRNGVFQMSVGYFL